MKGLNKLVELLVSSCIVLHLHQPLFIGGDHPLGLELCAALSKLERSATSHLMFGIAQGSLITLEQAALQDTWLKLMSGLRQNMSGRMRTSRARLIRMRIPTIIRGVARKGGPKSKVIACEARQFGQKATPTY